MCGKARELTFYSVWVMKENLREFDPNLDYLQKETPFDQPNILSSDDEKTKIEKQRRTAFRQDAMAFEGADYWHNFIKQKSEARKLEAQMYAQEKQRQSKLTPKRCRTTDEDDHSTWSRKRFSNGKRTWTEAKQLFTPKSSSKNFRGYEHVLQVSDDEDYGDNQDSNEDGLFIPKSSDDVFTEKKSTRQGKGAITPPEMG